MTNLENKLDKFALNVTKKNVTRKASGLNKKAIFHEFLLNNQKTKDEVVNHMTKLVFASESKIDLDKLDENNKQHVEAFLKVRTTCNNSFDSISCRGNNGATYWKDERYSDFELTKVGNKYQIKSVK